MSRPQGVAEAFARLCPDVPPELSPDVRLAISNPYISLQDIVITGLEGGYGWFLVESYKPEATGADMEPWAVVSEYPDDPNRHYALDRVSVRIGLIRWIDHMLDQGLEPVHIVSSLEDMDLNMADCVLQFATWGELRYG